MDVTQQSEKELVQALIEGDEKAFCELYALYKNRLLGFAVQFIKSSSIAEDLFQDVFTQIWQSRQFIDPNASFSSYLHTMMKNRVLNLMRDRSRREEIHLLILANSVDSDSSTESVVEENELQELLKNAIAKLSPKQREVFTLSREQQLTHKEIAEQMGISVYTVQEYMSISLKTIRNYLKIQFGEHSDLVLLLLMCLPVL